MGPFEPQTISRGLDLAGLTVISVGTGGVKACVAAFGADQFPQNYVTMISVYFAVFYWMIQAGSTISTVITPIFRSESHYTLRLRRQTALVDRFGKFYVCRSEVPQFGFASEIWSY